MTFASPNAPRLGWYGKIPAAGDFVRRLPHPLIDWWDRWLQNSLMALHRDAPGTAQARATYPQAPIWNFAIPATLGVPTIQVGCLLASQDRVGRPYPVCAVLPLQDSQWRDGLLAESGPWLRQVAGVLSGALRDGYVVDTVDQRLQALDGTASRLVLGESQAASAAPATPTAPAPTAAGAEILAILMGDNTQAPLPIGLPSRVSAPPEQVIDHALLSSFNPFSHTSYWWTNQADGAGWQSYLHAGHPNAMLFSRLFLAHGPR